jgi:hypothetical protein
MARREVIRLKLKPFVNASSSAAGMQYLMTRLVGVCVRITSVVRGAVSSTLTRMETWRLKPAHSKS